MRRINFIFGLFTIIFASCGKDLNESRVNNNNSEANIGPVVVCELTILDENNNSERIYFETIVLETNRSIVKSKEYDATVERILYEDGEYLGLLLVSDENWAASEFSYNAPSKAVVLGNSEIRQILSCK